ncbi:hypothetical protein TWF506_005342 [Arthrobotrys conoides]|uniref:Uncharacterized protein n=1 Tax=Arthrobotrys conoides TaxID=74498 RepID=A0AAN8PPK8_9PEZI
MLLSNRCNSHRGIREHTSLVLRTVALFASLTLPDHTKAQTLSPNYTITTVYETVENTYTITSTLSSCDIWTGLPQCNELVWPTLASNSTSTTTYTTPPPSTVSTLDPAITSISAPRGGFVLEEAFGGLYFQLDDDTGRVVLAAPGQDRLVSLTLGDNVENLLQNSRDRSEIVFLRYNATANQALEQESASVSSLLREIRHTVDTAGTLQSSDYVGEWVWNTTIGQVELNQNGRRWIIYKVAGNANSPALRSRDGLAKRENFYDLYMLPNDILVPEDSILQKAQFIANEDSRYETSYFSSLKATSTVSQSSSLSATKTISTTDSSSTTSSTMLDAYDVITSLGLEGYCSSILSYNSQTTTITSTSISLSTSYYALFTDPSSISTSTTTAGESSATVFISASVGTRKRDFTANQRSPEDQLTGYPTNSILSACSKAASSPTGTITETASSLTFSDVIEPISSTTQFGIGNTTATTTIPVVTETVKAIGGYKLVYNDLSDHSGPYYGQYISNTTGNPIGYTGATVDIPSLKWSPYYFETIRSYGLTRKYEIPGGQTLLTVLIWLGAGGPNAQGSVGDYSVYEFPVNGLQNSDYVPIYFNFNSTTVVMTPDNSNNPVSDPTFWICGAGGSNMMFLADAATLMALADFDAVINNPAADCINSGLTALQGGF